MNDQNPKTIKTDVYNAARRYLAGAGSSRAKAAHDGHGTKDVPVKWGLDVLRGARDEFRASDANLPAQQKNSGMSRAHYDAIHAAAEKMGIKFW